MKSQIIVKKYRKLNRGERVLKGDFWKSSLDGCLYVRENVGWFEKVKSNHCDHYRIYSLYESVIKNKTTNMKYTNDPDSAAERLEYLAHYEGSELGEVWRLLSSMWISYVDYISPEMAEILERDIIAEAERADNEYELVEKEKIIVRNETQLVSKKERVIEISLINGFKSTEESLNE
jgi:hypothetical protein